MQGDKSVVTKAAMCTAPHSHEHALVNGYHYANIAPFLGQEIRRYCASVYAAGTLVFKKLQGIRRSKTAYI